MRALAVSLRDPSRGHPVAAAAIGDVAIATVASAWGAWTGLEAEVPTVSDAHACLVAAARAGETDWQAALLRAFAAASAAIDRLPAAGGEDDEWHPLTCLTCAVVTPARVVVGWQGGVTACVLDDRGLVRETAPHTMLRLLLAHGHDPAALASSPLARGVGDVIARSVGPSRSQTSPPELDEWPPLGPGQRLLLTHHRTLTAIRQRPPPRHPDGDVWLRQALATVDDPGHRLGALVEA